jgi:hypothetical protein
LNKIIFSDNVSRPPVPSSRPSFANRAGLLSDRSEKVALAQEALKGLFNPKKGQTMLFVTDIWNPTSPKTTNPSWEDRISNAKIWHEAASMLAVQNGLELRPILSFPYGEHGDFPKNSFLGESEADARSEVLKADMLVCMPVFSFNFMHYMLERPVLPGEKKPSALFIGSSNPGFFNSCMESAESLNSRAGKLENALVGAIGIEITFHCPDSKDYALYVDIRGSAWIKDWEFKRNRPLWLPVGEYFTAPNPGNGNRDSSLTKGDWPIYDYKTGRYTILKVENNRIKGVTGKTQAAYEIERYLGHVGSNNDNIAEFALSFNRKARKLEFKFGENGRLESTGAKLSECEKAEGLHLAFGGNQHFTDVSDPHHVEGLNHVDHYYNGETPITATARAIFSDGRKELIVERGKHALF